MMYWVNIPNSKPPDLKRSAAACRWAASVRRFLPFAFGIVTLDDHSAIQ